MRNVKSNHRYPIVCLDPGHYGTYNHSPVVPAYSEAEMVWELHLLLKANLENYGIEVKTTRANTSVDPELTARGRMSDGCDLFISLHSNACGTESVDRTEGIHFVSRDGTDVDDRSKEIASMLAQTVYEVMGNNQKPKVYSKLAGSDRNRDGVKNDNYYGVLHGAWMVGTPGIIIEHSFHTNRRAATWLLNDSNLRRLAQAEAKTIAEWFDVSENADSSTTGWQKNDTGYWYVLPDGTYPTGKFERIDGVWYYFDEVGYMVTGWKHIDKVWYFFDNSGAMVTGWQCIEGKWYFFYDDGCMAANETTPDGYQVDELGVWRQPQWSSVQKWWYRHADGSYATNSFETIDGKTYYFDGDGYMVTGWRLIGENWYYFGADGAMVKDTVIDGYKINSDGVYVTD